MTQSGTIPASPSLESIYDILQNRRRRLILYYLRGVSEGVSRIDAVEEWILDQETEDTDKPGTDRDEMPVAATLHHFHLPKLADYGIIDYDWRTKTVRYRSDDRLEAHLNLAEQLDLK